MDFKMKLPNFTRSENEIVQLGVTRHTGLNVK